MFAKTTTNIVQVGLQQESALEIQGICTFTVKGVVAFVEVDAWTPISTVMHGPEEDIVRQMQGGCS